LGFPLRFGQAGRVVAGNLPSDSAGESSLSLRLSLSESEPELQQGMGFKFLPSGVQRPGPGLSSLQCSQPELGPSDSEGTVTSGASPDSDTPPMLPVDCEHDCEAEGDRGPMLDFSRVPVDSDAMTLFLRKQF
jgi:hypothetical protein